jgi:hypothetical protein
MLKKTTKDTKKLTYNQPKVYVLGSLKQVQAGYYGDVVDSSGSYYYQD